MKAILKKDIVIPAGTVFDTAPVVTRKVGDGHIETIIGLSDNSYGSLAYCLGGTEKEQEELSDWFEIVEK